MSRCCGRKGPKTPRWRSAVSSRGCWKIYKATGARVELLIKTNVGETWAPLTARERSELRCSPCTPPPPPPVGGVFVTSSLLGFLSAGFLSKSSSNPPRCSEGRRPPQESPTYCVFIPRPPSRVQQTVGCFRCYELWGNLTAGREAKGNAWRQRPSRRRNFTVFKMEACWNCPLVRHFHTQEIDLFSTAWGTWGEGVMPCEYSDFVELSSYWENSASCLLPSCSNPRLELPAENWVSLALATRGDFLKVGFSQNVDRWRCCCLGTLCDITNDWVAKLFVGPKN